MQMQTYTIPTPVRGILDDSLLKTIEDWSVRDMHDPDIVMSTYAHNTRHQQPDEENVLAPENGEVGYHNDMEGLPYEDKVLWACLIIATVMLILIL